MKVLPGTERANPLPESALIVAATVERGAVLGMAFDTVDLVTLEDLPAVLSLRGSAVRCVVITAVSTRGGRLAGALAQVRTHCPPTVQIFIDVSGPGAPDLLRDGGQAMRGFRTVGCATLWDTPCLAIEVAGAPDEVPELSCLNGVVGAPKTLLAASRSATVPPAPLSPGPARLNRAAARSHPTTPLRARTAGSRPGGFPTRRQLQVLGLGGAALVAVGAVLAFATDSGFSGFALAVLVGLVAVHLLDSLRARVLLARRLDQLSAAVRDRAGPGAVGDSEAKLSKQLSQVTARLTEIEQDVAILAASTVDTARSVARLHNGEPTAGQPAHSPPRP
ncbi:MAG: hypothetical protein ACT4P1_10220 [Sporichthyaceae bacterium]